MNPGKTGIARIIAAAGHSINGMKACWEHEAAYRQDVALSLVLFIASFFVAKSASQWLLLISPLFLLLIVESLNSAIEAAVDRISTEYHDLSGRAKDIASAAVFFCLCLIVVSWGAIAWTNFA
jgi:diacylglycerol kinase (ATP)